MGRTSITRWSKTAGAGGIGNMRRGIRYLKVWRRKRRRRRKGCGLIRSRCRLGVAEGAAAEGKKLNGLLRGLVRKWGFYIVLESDLMGWRVGGPGTFLPSEATRNERSFEKERQRTPRQREWTAKHPLPCRRRGVDGEWDQLPRVSIEQHGGGCFLPTLKIPQSSPHLR
jgi:hypothetical protein